MKPIETQGNGHMKQNLAIHPDHPVWEDSDDKIRVLFVAVNISGYYSLPVRIHTLMLDEDPRFKTDFSFRFIEFENIEPIDRAFEVIRDLTPDIIGFSVNIWNRDICFELAKQLKTINQHLKCIAGGQEVTNSTVDYLSEHTEIDYIIDGEGEIPLTQFLENWDAAQYDIIDPETVSGLHYRKEGIPVFTGRADLVKSLDDIPSPILSGLIDPGVKYRLGTMVEGTRGCPFKCSFCFEGGEKRKVRTASLERIKDEIEYMASRGVKFFHLMDPILCNSNSERLKELAAFFDKMNALYQNIIVSVEAYAHHINPEVAQSLKNFRLIDIGLQTVNPKTAKAINRPWQPEKFKAGLDCLRQAKARFTIYLICGLPHETLDSFVHGMCVVINENPSQLFFNELLLLNGTELRRRQVEYGYVYDEKPPYQVYANLWMSKNQLRLANLIAKDVEKRYNFAARAIHTNAPWIPDTVERFEYIVKIVPGSGCSQNCAGCAKGNPEQLPPFFDDTVLSQLKEVANRDVEIILGEAFDRNELLKLIGQLVLGGSARIKLTAPSTVFADRQWLDLLVKRGIWHFKTFMAVSGHADVDAQKNAVQSFMDGLEHFSTPVDLRGYASISPHFELVVLADDAMDPNDYSRIAAMAAQPYISVITVPADIVETKGKGFEANISGMIQMGMDKDTWVKLPVSIWETYFADQQVDLSIITSLQELGMICDEPCQPPCFEQTTIFDGITISEKKG